MTPLPVWRRPGVLLLVFGYRLLASVLIALPLTAAVGATGIGHFPTGDSVLFEPGAVMLTELLRMGGAYLPAAGLVSAGILIAACLVSVLPLSFWLVALCQSGKLRLKSWLGQAADRVPGLFLISGIAWMFRGLIAVVFALTFFSMDEDARWELFACAGVAGVILMAVSFTEGLVQAAYVRHSGGVLEAIRGGFAALGKRGGYAVLGYLAPALGSLVVLVVFATVLHYPRGTESSTWMLALSNVLHQVGVLTLVLLRGWWLSTALSAVGPKP